MYYDFLVLITLLLSVLIYLKWNRVNKFWSERGVPNNPPHFILGSLTFLQRKNPGLWMRELYNQFKPCPYVGIWVFWRPGLVVNCPELACKILIKDSDNFRNRLLSSGKRDPIGGLNLFTVNDPLWSSVRKRLTAVFTAAKLRALHYLYHSKSKNLIQRIRADTEKGIKINLRSMFSDYSTDVIGEASFGVSCDATVTGASALRSTTREFERYSAWRGLAWSTIFFFPELVDVFGFSLFPKQTIGYFRKVFKMIVSQRGGYDIEKTEDRDLLDALVKMKQEAAKENDDMSEDVLIAQAAMFLQAGYDTSSAALSYATYELAFHPHCQEKLYEELSEAKTGLGDKDFNAAILAELTYLNAVINETFRKYPIMGWLDRVALNEYQIDENLTIPSGTVGYVNAAGMQMDPEYFPEPEQFKPDRFLPENERNIPAYTYMPFGKRFGLNTVRYALAKIVLNYTLRPWEYSPRPNDCEVEKKGLFFLPGETLSVKFISRN